MRYSSLGRGRPMEYRIGAGELKRTLLVWDELIPGRGKIRIVACGGTALVLIFIF